MSTCHIKPLLSTPYKKVNISSYSVYINENYFGDNVTQIQLNSGDSLKVSVVKPDYYGNTSMVFYNLLV